VWSFVVLFLSCRVWCCSCCVFVCVTCFSIHRRRRTLFTARRTASERPTAARRPTEPMGWRGRIGFQQTEVSEPNSSQNQKCRLLTMDARTIFLLSRTFQGKYSLDTGGGRVFSLDASIGLLATASTSALALFLGSAG